MTQVLFVPLMFPLVLFFVFFAIARQRARRSNQTTLAVMRQMSRRRFVQQPQQQVPPAAPPVPMATAVPVGPAMAAAPVGAASTVGIVSVADQLHQLSVMYENGLLTDEQFQAAKAQALMSSSGMTTISTTTVMGSGAGSADVPIVMAQAVPVDQQGMPMVANAATASVCA